MTSRRSNYDKRPFVQASADERECAAGWTEIAARLQAVIGASRRVVCVECYPGVFLEDIECALKAALRPAIIIRAENSLKASSEIERLTQPFLDHDDPVFGRLTSLNLPDFFDASKLSSARTAIEHAPGTVLILGTGAAFVAPQHDLLIYADLGRWEIELRQRRGEIGNWGVANISESPAAKYKRGFFVDWRVADRWKKGLLDKLDFLLDTSERQTPRMISGEAFRSALALAARRPFRVVPYFDPGPWGGHWMEEVCDLPHNVPNYAWCFDCVPEENSLLLGFGSHRVAIPAIDLVFRHPRELLGDSVYARFGAEFPIRFDFLDTMGGGNLSLQVHPTTRYIREHFGISYTQDESYYLLDAADDGAVFLGLKQGISRYEMVHDLRSAQAGDFAFPADKYVNRWPAKKHDHFLIPAGTIHCSGRNSMVLEISATPYIFTFKLWDWGRPGLDGKPRPIHLDHGIANIDWSRTTDWVRENLIHRVEPLASGPGWREERTGLHELEFIETRRHWFREKVPHDTAGGVNVLNLVQGEEVIVESPGAAFEPFILHYAETMIVPAAVGHFTIRPHGEAQGTECATIKAYVH
ncbi:MAG: class I mannose-6-phosphate isomerase [Candidatus Acidiferrales bacterium]